MLYSILETGREGRKEETIHKIIISICKKRSRMWERFYTEDIKNVCVKN